jgi:hypothetical protein
MTRTADHITGSAPRIYYNAVQQHMPDHPDLKSEPAIPSHNRPSRPQPKTRTAHLESQPNHLPKAVLSRTSSLDYGRIFPESPVLQALQPIYATDNAGTVSKTAAFTRQTRLKPRKTAAQFRNNQPNDLRCPNQATKARAMQAPRLTHPNPQMQYPITVRPGYCICTLPARSCRHTPHSLSETTKKKIQRG